MPPYVRILAVNTANLATLAPRYLAPHGDEEEGEDGEAEQGEGGSVRGKPAQRGCQV